MRSFILVLVVYGWSSAADNQVDRRDRAEPEIVINAGGRFGTCDVLRFSADGTALFAAGDDKCVTVWQHSAEGLNTDPGAQEVLRWPAWREKRGGIKCLAISPDGKRVAVGGLGLITSSVAILERDPEGGREPRVVGFTWPKIKPGQANHGAVTAITFDAEAKRIAFGTADGSLWLWTPTKLPQADDEDRTWSAPVRAARHSNSFKNAEFDDNLSRWIGFRTSDKLLSVSKAGQVLEATITDTLSDDPLVKAPSGKELFNVNTGVLHHGKAIAERVYRAELIDGGKAFALGMIGPRVLVRKLDGTAPVVHELPAEHFPRSLAYDAKTGRLAIGVGKLVPAVGDQPRFFLEASDQVLLLANAYAAEPAKELHQHTGPADAMAFHPVQNDRLAIAGGAADQVILLKLGDPAKPLSVIHGAGRRLTGVELANHGKLLRFRTDTQADATHPNTRDAGAWHGFDLTRMVSTTDVADDRHTWMPERDTLPGWRVKPIRRDLWYVESTDNGMSASVPLSLDVAQFNFPTCYTFIPKTAEQPARLLVGHGHGASLYHLPEPGKLPKELAPVRVFVGHVSDVHSLTVTADASWFISAGADQTLAAFNLKNSDAPALGAKIAPSKTDSRLSVKEVVTGSPAWEAGLFAGDEIDFLAIGGEVVFDQRPVALRTRNGTTSPTVGRVADVITLLESAQPAIELYFNVLPRGAGQRRVTLTTLPQRPLWKFFPAFDAQNRLTDWVIWSWKGSYYHTTTAHGDRLVGWVVNSTKRDGTPRFHELQAFEKQFHRRDVLRKLLGSRELEAALQVALGDNPQPVSFAQVEPPEIDLQVDTLSVFDGTVAVKVQIEPRGSNLDLQPERVELWLNDYRVARWANEPRQTFQQKIELPAKLFRNGDNQLTVLTVNPAGGRENKQQTIRNKAEQQKSNLVAYHVGVDDYGVHQAVSRGERSVLGNLRYAYKDASSLSKAFGSYVGERGYFPKGELMVRRDSDAARAKLLDDLEHLQQQVQPNDTLVLFLAGHGVLVGERNGNIEVVDERIEDPEQVYKKMNFVFCCPDFNRSNTESTAIAAADLFDALARINCTKVMLLDVCHSGDVVSENIIREFVPEGQGPFILAACDRSQRSYEHPSLEHGLFTASLLEALGDQRHRAVDQSGRMTFTSLTNYVKNRVYALRRETRGPNEDGDQMPLSFPRTPPAVVLLK